MAYTSDFLAASGGGGGGGLIYGPAELDRGGVCSAIYRADSLPKHIFMEN